MEEQKGMELYGIKSMYSSMVFYDFGMDLWISCMDSCLWVVGCKKPNPRMKSCMETDIEYETMTIEYGSLDFVWDYVYLDHGRDLYGFQT